MPAILPCPTNDALTGKNTAASSPPMVNSREPERSSAETVGMDQSREWLEGLSDHSPAWDDTVGYEPALVKKAIMSKIASQVIGGVRTEEE